MDAPATQDTYCSLLWTHICIRPQFTMLPCCRFIDKRAHVSSYDVDVNSPFFVDLRKKMISGEPILGCQECYIEEAAIQESLRLTSNKINPRQVTTDVTTSYDQINYLELFVGSNCNLKCIGCSPHLSSSLYAEYKKNKWHLPDQTTHQKKIDIRFIEKLTNLKHIKFVGGEPFLNNLHDEALQYLAPLSLQNIKLTYYTNCTSLPNQATLEVWKNTKQVNLTLSIDGIGARNEYLRKNSHWTVVNEVAHKYFDLAQKHGNMVIQINVTVSILNLLYLNEIETWFSDICNKYPNVRTHPVYLSYLTDPPELACHNAPQSLIEVARNLYRNTKYLQQTKVLKMMDEQLGSADPYGKDHFLKYVGKFDLARQNSFKNVFPELNHHF